MTIVLALIALAVLGGAVAVAVPGLRAARTERASAGSRDAALAEGRSAVARARSEASEMVSQARAAALRTREEALDELAARRTELEAVEARLTELDREIQNRRRLFDEHRQEVGQRRDALEAQREELAEQRREAERMLERVAGVDREGAAAAVLARVEGELTGEHAGRVARALNGRVGDLVPTAQSLVVEAIQRQDEPHADAAPRPGPVALEGLSDSSRDRLLEALAAVAEDTSTDLAVDAERNQATLRGLDPVGREVARQASLEVLERRLRSDDVPALLTRTRRSLAQRIRELGERALWEMQIDARPEVAELLGTLHYRFSYGQNALLHVQETGHLCAALAGELRMSEAAARAAGLLHDIGKAVDHDVEGSHAIIGGELLTLLGVDAGVVHAVKAHHFDEEPETDLAMLTICADAISASRPGARRDTLTTYMQRLEQLQQIATRHGGVERAFPMQAGREVRVSVRPDQVSDDAVPALCAEIAREIEAEMTYPGMIKVTVIRETTAHATAS